MTPLDILMLALLIATGCGLLGVLLCVGVRAWEAIARRWTRPDALARYDANFRSRKFIDG